MAIKKTKDMEEIKIIPSDVDKAAIARAKRIAMAGLTTEKVEEISTREAFRIYFIQLKKKINLPSELENIIWLHFKAAGFDKPEMFDKGIRHFGYNI